MKKLAPDQRKRFRYPLKLVPQQKAETPDTWQQIVRKALPKSFKKLKESLLSHPHLYIVSLSFLILFIWDYVNFITFISLGFFCVLLSDHLIENFKTYWKKRQTQSQANKEADAALSNKPQDNTALLKLAKRKGTSHWQNKLPPPN